jgi:hypothetical protein
LNEMPRYFFHTADGSVDRDTEGQELRDANAARTQAVKFAADCLADNPEFLWQSCDFRVDVTDEADLTVFTLITIALDGPSYVRGRPRAG